MRISEQLLTDTDLDAATCESLENKRNILQTKVKTAEKKASSESLLPPDFRLRVEEEISKLFPPTEGVTVHHTTGCFQADSRICKLVQDGAAQVILSNDSDYSFILGAQCLQICNFKLEIPRPTL